MSNQSPIRPDPMPLREALRGLRHMLRRGGETLAETITVDALPGPAAGIAGAVLREVGGLAQRVDMVASGLAKSVLGGHDPAVVSLTDLGQAPDADARFAEAVYVALRSVLGRLGAPLAFVSEASARNVYARAAGRAAAAPSILAAVLTLDLLSARVLRDATAEEAARVPGAALEPVAIFAVLLWLQASRSELENEAALDAATDLAVAIAPEIARACAEGDTARLTALFEKYAAHV
ncbi:MAG: hypothetical protein ACT4OK_06655 [Gemmobacter sp.]